MIGQSIGQQLDERDQYLMAQTFEFAMEKAPTNETAKWENPDTGAQGSVTPTKTVVVAEGTPCREFTTTVSIGGQEEEAYGTACRQADGSWKIQE